MAFALVVTRGVGVYLPPELHTAVPRMIRDARNCATRLSQRRHEFDVEVGVPVPVGQGRTLHMIAVPFEPAWHACPLWLGIHLSEKADSLRVTPMAADDGEARTWFANETKGATPSRALVDAFYEVTLTRRGVTTYVGVHRAKRICGPK